MPKMVAFLRGMNLGGRRIKNPELSAAFESLGFANVEVFLASGNVVFDTDDATAKTKKRLEAGLESQLGYPVPTFLRAAKQVRTLAELMPFADDPAVGGKAKPQVVFLTEKLEARAVREIEALASDDDRLQSHGTEILWLPRRGVGQSELDFKALEKVAGTTTVRTHNTVVRLTKKYL